jgi:DNA-binding LytR/AlgR family response regulator
MASGDGVRFRFTIQASSYSIAANQILFFEAANKKVRLRTKAQEFEFYDSLNSLEERLPPKFIRIHKSFIVNSERIINVDFVGMLVYFDDGSSAMISRTRKAALKDSWEDAR